MPLIAYQEWNAREATLEIVNAANAIIDEYRAKGFDLTLRQLYYQFVARDLIENKQTEYDRLGMIINNARMAGLVDWAAIVDRTRNLRKNNHWDNPAQIIRACADQFEIDKWAMQENRVEVWIEKDALVGVISGVCSRLDVPYFSCRGYTSQSEMWRAGHYRLARNLRNDQTNYILHLGDHDPSGLDMTRDIAERLETFTGAYVEINRLALNMDQVEELGPPPNPAKLSDSRARQYILAYGRESWELDALEPEYIENLIRTTVLSLRDEDAWERALAKEAGMRDVLRGIADEQDD